MVYEKFNHRLLSRAEFARRVAAHLLLIGGALAVALGMGVCGYRFIAGLTWVDSLLNASMILSGMGPTNPLPTDAAKVFASVYALFSGLFFVALAGVLAAPFLHRLLHHFHVSDEDEQGEEER